MGGAFRKEGMGRGMVPFPHLYNPLSLPIPPPSLPYKKGNGEGVEVDRAGEGRGVGKGTEEGYRGGDERGDSLCVEG